MLKINTLLIAVFLLYSCTTPPPILKGADGSEIPPYYTQFPDVPFPEPAYIDLKETKALGSGEKWIGSIVYTTPYNASSVFDFYMSEMPKLKWLEVATVRSQISHMTYMKSSRALQILIENVSDNKAKVTITAIPNDAV